MVESAGPGFTGAYSKADIYATAMCLGSAQVEQDRATGQQNPLKCTEFLSGLEEQYEIVAASTASDQDRRLALDAARQLRNGARVDAIEDGLRGILGAGFVEYIVASGVTPIPATATAPAAFKPANTLITVIRLTTYTMPGSQTIAYTHIAGAAASFSTGEVLVVSPNMNGIAEPVTLTATTGGGSSGTITATFTKAHDPLAYATTAPWPMWRSFQRHVIVIVSAAALADNQLMRRVKSFMRKWSRVVTWWAAFPENSPGSGTSGPFYPNLGHPNITPVGAVTW
jgi:hypothetical protein